MEKIVSPALIFRILGANEVRLVFSGEELYLNTSNNERLKVDLDRLVDGELYRRGVFCSTLAFNTDKGKKFFRWLPDKGAMMTCEWLREIWSRKVAPRVHRAATEVRNVLGAGYLRDSRLQRIRRIIAGQHSACEKLPPDGAISPRQMEDMKLLYNLASWGERELDACRENYVKEKKIEFSDYFDTIESNPLTDSQRDACVIDQDNNLVLAGAGTGKTSTMIGRAGFLVKSGQARPDQILLLAYANKAAAEMQERLDERIGGKSIQAGTFHKLGKNIIAVVEGGQPSLSPLADDEKQLAYHVNKWFEEKMLQEAYKNKVLEYFSYYLYPSANPFDFESEGEYFDYLLDNEIRTLNGEAVKSLGECLIANHLFKLGVQYEYEAAYERPTRSFDFRQYQPDFYLPEYKIYIEHLGIDRNGETAPYVNREAYHRDIKWKRALHRKHGTVLVETFHYEQTENILLNLLETRLQSRGVVFNSLPPEAVLQKLREFGAISKFAELLSKLLRRYKSGGFDRQKIQPVISESSDPEQLSAVFGLLSPILDEYESKLADENQIDFDDMISRATAYVSGGRFNSPWRYILVDEFQDISDPRAKLVKALKDSVSECSLFCVGDDWQAIYRFAGSDISYTTEFEDKFGATKTTVLDKTFRFNNSICGIASRFVLENPRQIRKTISAPIAVDKPAVSLLRKPDRSANNPDRVDRRVTDVLDKISSLAEDGASVYLLSRYGFGLPSPEKVRRFTEEYPALSISAMTMHASKGKEADFAVLLGLQSGNNGFPSQKSDHPLLEALLPGAESFPYAEERRLFYVALTRAKHRVYLICDMLLASGFIVELINDDYPIALNEFEASLTQMLFQALKCIKCKTGTMVPREGKFGAFFGCIYYPLCDNTENGCKECGTQMQRLDRSRVCINPDCEAKVLVCPRCGADMAIRESRRGKFWGCSNYRGNKENSCFSTESINAPE